jgi:hypothetical protein
MADPAPSFPLYERLDSACYFPPRSDPSEQSLSFVEQISVRSVTHVAHVDLCALPKTEPQIFHISPMPIDLLFVLLPLRSIHH